MTAGLPPWAQVTAERRRHIERVAELLIGWATARDLPESERQRWIRAAVLHDALKDAPVELLRELAPNAWSTDALRHGPAAAEMAARLGETDRGVLDAARYHSVGYASWDDVGRMLYLADFLEPGRSGSDVERGALREQVPRDPRAVLRAVAELRLHRSMSLGQPLLRETVAFWNALVCDG